MIADLKHIGKRSRAAVGGHVPALDSRTKPRLSCQ